MLIFSCKVRQNHFFSFIEIHKLVTKSLCKDNYEIFSMYGLQQIYIAKKVNILIQKIAYEIVY